MEEEPCSYVHLTLPSSADVGHTILTSEDAPVTAVEPHNERAIDLASFGGFRGPMGRELLACYVAGVPREE